MIPKKGRIKKDWESTFFSVFLSLLFFGILGFLVVSNYNINRRRSEMLNQIDSLKKQLQTLEDQNAKLQGGIIEVTTDTYQEEKLREQGYQKEEEQNVVVLPAQENASTSKKTERNFFEKIFDFFRP
jgi:cell division protein FtsB